MQVNDLLADGVHLNAHGNYLMASIVKEYFNALRPSNSAYTPVDEFRDEEHFAATGKLLKQYVKGNRVDIVFNDKEKKGKKIDIELNGKKPRKLNSCYYYSRPTLDSNRHFLTKIGQLLAMQLAGEVREQDWTMTITRVDSVQQQVGFSLHGSLTGEEGSGSSDSTFTSATNTIIIEPTFWFRAKAFANFPWLVPGDVLHWQVRSMCNNKIYTGTGQIATIVQGVKNGTHRLKLKGKGVKQVKAIRVYAPPLKS